ncbi:MAG: cob(I)yrinic acid a,c-diamide adenosyltransferase [Rikenellaceae bacterium]
MQSYTHWSSTSNDRGVESGLIHIYTGDGKGKTTSAIGLAVRALGGGFKVCYTSFHKRPERYGYTEMDSLRKLGATVLNFAKGHPKLDRSIDPELTKRETKQAITQIEELLKENSFDMLIMDEILISVRDNYISEECLVDFIHNKPDELELVLTGRGATEGVIALADYVSYIKKERHPFDRGIASRKGVE